MTKALKENNTVRVLMYHGSKDSLYMKSLQNIHQGESCFVIGNGLSLTAEDLDTLYSRGTVCFAVNVYIRAMDEQL